MTLKYENQKIKQGYSHVIGCDEVGRGCLAGPVVAAAVTLPQIRNSNIEIRNRKQIRDSKLLSAAKRQELSALIKQQALWGIGVVDEKVIDKINIHHASLLAMKRAVVNLIGSISRRVHPSREIYSSKVNRSLHSAADNNQTAASVGMVEECFLYVDGKFAVPDINLDQQAVVDGDNKILSVAAASIVAKVYRDDLMKQYHRQYPIYNFAQHKGYATFHHRQMVMRHGLSVIHRLSFCEHLV